MNLHNLLSTRERVKILKSVLFKKDEMGVNSVAKELKLSKGLVSKYFDILSKEKVIRKRNGKYSVQENLNTVSLKILINLENFDPMIFRKFGFVESAGLFGSIVKGKNTEESDIDLWVLVEKTGEENMAKLTAELKKKYFKINPVYLTIDKLKVLKREDPVFHHSLFFGSITVYGDGIEKV
ncbi:MAG: nucleotidyltransferase domain-containing protein [Candidatus Aenigmarchaeota archaeon]|nr:nucleotidyltransferase domain-containing protein [Candidatus Aenigmarchaeota archaeon]